MKVDRFSDARVLAEGLIVDIESGSTDYDLACLKAARLALLLKDPDKSELFASFAREAGECQAHVGAVEERLDMVLAEDPFMSHLALPDALRRDNKIARQKKEIQSLQKNKKRLSEIKVAVYEFALGVYYRLRFSEVPESVLSRARITVDRRLADLLPDSKEKFYSVASNLESSNPEDWANAVHSCRRIIQEVADRLCPPSRGDAVLGDGRKVKMNPLAPKNRLIIYVESKSGSKRFRDLVGSHVSYLQDRLDAVYEATNKGSHSRIGSREEAERYVVFTYLLLGDILSL